MLCQLSTSGKVADSFINTILATFHLETKCATIISFWLKGLALTGIFSKNH